MRLAYTTLMVLLATAVASMTGCVSVPPSARSLSERWSRSIFELGITPIFPPREDVYVGDIYVSSEPSVEPRPDGVFGSRATRWTSVPLGGVMKAESWWRPQLPAFGSGDDFTPKDSKPPLPGDDSTTPPSFHSSNPLRLVAFPEFTAASIGIAEASAIIPSEVFQADIGITADHINSVGLKISEAYSYAVPGLFVLRELIVNRDEFERKSLAWGTRAMGVEGAPLAGPIQMKIPGLDLVARRSMRPVKVGDLIVGWEPNRGFFQRPALKAGTEMQYDPVYLTIVTEVFYARSVDVSLFDQTGGGARARVSPRPLDAPIAASPAPVPPSDDRTTAGAIDAANKRLSDLANTTGSGINVRIVGATSRSIVLRRTYPRPVAIGYRGFSLEVDPMSGIVNYITEVRGAGSLQGPSGKGVSSMWNDRASVTPTWNTEPKQDVKPDPQGEQQPKKSNQ